MESTARVIKKTGVKAPPIEPHVDSSVDTRTGGR